MSKQRASSRSQGLAPNPAGPTASPATSPTASSADVGSNSAIQDAIAQGDAAIAAHGLEGPAMAVPYLSELSAAFGQSFGAVTAHGGAPAAEATQALGAQAYVVGKEIVFGTGSPSKQLVAHELVHTLQQSAGFGGQRMGGAFEAEADAAAAMALAGQKPQVKLHSAPGIMMWGGAEHYLMGNMAGMKAKKLAKPPRADKPTQGKDWSQNTGGTLAVTDRALGGAAPKPFQGTPFEGSPLAAVADANKASTSADGSNPVVPSDPNAQKEFFSFYKGKGDLKFADATVSSDNALYFGAGNWSFGAATRRGGDYDSSTSDMGGSKLGGDTNSGSQKDALTGDTEEDFYAMVDIGATNANHFYPGNGGEWGAHHKKALALAQKAFSAPLLARASLRNLALAEEGMASHFLMDSFASGHHIPRYLDRVESDGDIEEGYGLGFAIEGKDRTKPWHDIFCTYALPTSQGTFHGDNYMTGGEAAYISNVAALSLTEILDAANGHSTSFGVRPAVPNYGGIKANPETGLLWDIMERNYAAAAKRAKAHPEYKTNETETATGTDVDSSETIDAISQNTVRQPGDRIEPGGNSSDGQKLIGAMDATVHVLTAHWGRNANLSTDGGRTGLNDDLRTKSVKSGGLTDNGDGGVEFDDMVQMKDTGEETTTGNSSIRLPMLQIVKDLAKHIFDSDAATAVEKVTVFNVITVVNAARSENSSLFGDNDYEVADYIVKRFRDQRGQLAKIYLKSAPKKS